jgi:RNA-dependent RNA polymerase
MALEDLGVEKDAFMDLQKAAIQQIHLAGNSLKIFVGLLKSHGLGDNFRLPFILEQLIKLRLDFEDYLDREAIGSAFFGRLVRDSINHSLREVKFKARIPVPHSYQLVGVADEGQAYIKEGVDPDRVFTLKEKCIYGMFFFRGFLLVPLRLTHEMTFIKSACKRRRTKNPYISRAHVSFPGAQ